MEELFGRRGKPVLILAPMVRAGTLPLRLLALHHGADTVFSEELIARKLCSCLRVENRALRTVDFVTPGGKQNLVYRTCDLEAGRNVLQLGSASPEEALHAAQLVANDVAGIDLNMGCPEHFSIHAGMGAALLSPQPELACEILRKLRGNLPAHVTVSCKVRLLETYSESESMLRQLESAGAQAITIHARRRSERPRDRARWEELEPLVTCVDVPVVVNGSVFVRDTDFDAILNQVPSASGIMVARGAMGDFSAAFGAPPLSAAQVAERYLAVSELCGFHFGSVKWFLSQLLRYRSDLDKKGMTEALAKSRTANDLKAAYGIHPPLREHVKLWDAEKCTWEGALQRALYPLQEEIKRARVE